jgi:hypothetical protein
MAELLPTSCDPITTGLRAGALTVAGQWRIFTAFPNILAIAVVNVAVPWRNSRYIMKAIFMI